MPARRLDALDALRGVAMVWMTVFHFCFDLNHFGWIHQNMLSDPLWTGQRTAIVSLFLFCAGAGQAAAAQQHLPWRRFWQRWAQIAAGALLVSLGSWWMFPATYIHFGVLHGIAVMLVVVRLTAGWGRWLWWLGACAIALQFVAEYVHGIWPGMAFLDTKAFNWIGLIGHRPHTEDYVPVLPWLGVMWWGMACGQRLFLKPPAWLSRMAVPQPLAWLGRWSLSYYLLHQPVMLGLLFLMARAM